MPFQAIPPVVSLSNSQTKLRLWRGDITTLTDVTAIVNAANSQLLGCFQPAHRCIDNVIHSAAGPGLRGACYQIMQEQGHAEPVGSVKVTPGFSLPAKWVLHTVGPSLNRGQGGPTATQKMQLASCYSSCLDAVEALPSLSDGRKAIAFCCISTGIFAFPGRLAANIAVDTVVKWCQEHPQTTITDVIFDVFAEGDWELYETKLNDLAVYNPPVPKEPSSLALQPYDGQHLAVHKARQWLKEADTLIISAGAGLSAATGLDYASSALFEKHFPAFVSLDLNRLYDVFGFDGWESQTQKWGYYINHLTMVQSWPRSPLYATLQGFIRRFGPRYFIRTSNADGFFEANGFDAERISTPQGQYKYLQCPAKCRRDAVFPSQSFLTAALPCVDPETQCLTDESMVPICDYCGSELTLCVRGGSYFNPSPFLDQEKKYEAFLEGTAKSSNTVILELGVGMNTPGVLRWHNDDIVSQSKGKARLIRAGIGAAGCVPWKIEEKNIAVGIEGDLNRVLGVLIDN